MCRIFNSLVVLSVFLATIILTLLNIVTPDIAEAQKKNDLRVTPETLSLGLTLPSGSSILTWDMGSRVEPQPITSSLSSILNSLTYVYNINERKYWFNPSGKYAAYKNLPWYRDRLFANLTSGQQYRLRLTNSAELKNDILFCPILNSIEDDGGANPFRYGKIGFIEYITDENGLTISTSLIPLASDRCINDSKLIETSCTARTHIPGQNTSPTIKFSEINCPNGCKDGACIMEEPTSFCDDSERCVNKATTVSCFGHNPKLNGEPSPFIQYNINVYYQPTSESGVDDNINPQSYRFLDSCVDSKHKRHLVCEQIELPGMTEKFLLPSSQQIACPNNYSCLEGRCVEDPPASEILRTKGDINNDGTINNQDSKKLADLIEQQRYEDRGDLDSDGLVDEYDLYRIILSIEQGSALDDRYPIRNFELLSLGNLEPWNAKSLGTLSELSSNESMLQSWKIELEKKGNSRDICSPPILALNLKDTKPSSRISGMSQNGKSSLRYDKFKLVPDCDVWTLSDADNLIREYFAYWLYKEFKVPTIDSIGFGKMNLSAPDFNRGNKKFNYLMLQRENSEKDEIPFLKQYNFARFIDSAKGNYDRCCDLKSYFNFTLKKLEVPQETLEFEVDNVVRQLILGEFIGRFDQGKVNNVDYGFVSAINKWQYIPYDFDATFSCTGARTVELVKELPDPASQLGAEARQKSLLVAKEIFDNRFNLYKMLHAVDRYPFASNKTKLKNEIRFRFYQAAATYGSQAFASKLRVQPLPFEDREDLRLEANRFLQNRTSLDSLCTENSGRSDDIIRELNKP